LDCVTDPIIGVAANPLLPPFFRVPPPIFVSSETTAFFPAQSDGTVLFQGSGDVNPQNLTSILAKNATPERRPEVFANDSSAVWVRDIRFFRR
jgi:hypothetical protein